MAEAASDLPVKGSQIDLEQIEQNLTRVNPQLFKGINDAKKAELLKSVSVTIQQTIMASHYQGPLPPADQLQKYAVSIPNGGERIMAMAERQQEHRFRLESIAIPEQLAQSKRGQTFGFIIGLVALVGGVTCILFGKEWSGAILGGGGLTGLVSVFVIGKNKQNKSLEKKNAA